MLELLLKDKQINMVSIAQLVRALDCDSRGRRFNSGYSPFLKPIPFGVGFFSFTNW